MNSREKIKNAYQSLQCFRNPLIKELADDLKDAYHDLFNEGVDEIIHDVLQGTAVTRKELLSKRRKYIIVQKRKEVAIIASQHGYTRKQVGEALNRDPSTITHYLKSQ